MEIGGLGRGRDVKVVCNCVCVMVYSGGEFTSQSTYKYRAQSMVSGVFQNVDPPPPIHPASVSSPRTKGGEGGVHTRRAVSGWGVNIFEDAIHWIGLLQYTPSTVYLN